MKSDQILDRNRLQKIVTDRRAVREELAAEIIELLNAMPAGYGMSLDGFRQQAIERIRAIVGLLPEGKK